MENRFLKGVGGHGGRKGTPDHGQGEPASGLRGVRRFSQWLGKEPDKNKVGEGEKNILRRKRLQGAKGQKGQAGSLSSDRREPRKVKGKKKADSPKRAAHRTISEKHQRPTRRRRGSHRMYQLERSPARMIDHQEYRETKRHRREKSVGEKTSGFPTPTNPRDKKWEKKRSSGKSGGKCPYKRDISKGKNHSSGKRPLRRTRTRTKGKQDKALGGSGSEKRRRRRPSSRRQAGHDRLAGGRGIKRISEGRKRGQKSKR